MKILLVGEYSSLHKNLKEGLVELGHEVTIVSDSCGWMNISPDVEFSSKIPGFIGKIDTWIVKPLAALPKLKDYDVVQFMSPLVLSPRTLPLLKYFYKSLITKNKKSFLLAAGDDSYFANITNKSLRYSPWTGAIEHDGFSPALWESKEVSDWNDELVDLVNGVIPIMYEYQYGYKQKNIKNLCDIIPIPVNIDKIDYIENKIKSKLVFFHGLNRYGFKGTSFIESAFEKFQGKYPNDVICKIAGKMPLKEYLGLLSTVNVSLDQVLSYSYGVNAVYSLAMGHVVMSGSEPESLIGFGINESPIINIEPNSNQIYTMIERVFENRRNIAEMGYLSRKYAEDMHGYIKVAKQYLDVWNRY